MRPMCCAFCVCAIVLPLVTPASAQTDSAAPQPAPREAPPPPAVAPPEPTAVDRPIVRLFPNLLGDLRRLPSTGTAVALGLGAVASLVARPNDKHLSKHATAGGTDQIFAVGGELGTGYVQAGGALATYALGRLTSRPRVAHIGSDLIRAQVLTGLLTHSLKMTVRRHRPGVRAGSYAFPSGHASGTFASATVLWRHFGWKVGAPATLIAAYSSAARVQQGQHYLSDIAFGAALGIAGARTVTLGHGGPKMVLTPVPMPGGGGIFVTLIER